MGCAAGSTKRHACLTQERENPGLIRAGRRHRRPAAVEVEVEERVAGLHVVGDVEEPPSFVALGLDEIGVLDDTDERNVGIADVRPVEEFVTCWSTSIRTQSAVWYSRAAHLDQILVAELLGEPRRGAPRRRPMEPWPGRRRSAPARPRPRSRAGRAPRETSSQRPGVTRKPAVAGQGSRRTIDEHAAAVALDQLGQPPEDRLEAPPRVAQQLLPRLLALDLAPERELAPQPRHRDLVGAARRTSRAAAAPRRLVGLAAHLADDPLAGRHVLEWLDALWRR